MDSTLNQAAVVWDPADYAENSAAQHSWGRKLIARLQLSGDERVLDIGCGDGKVTAELAQAVPRGSVVGIDASEEMIGFARSAFDGAHSNLAFEVMDARNLELAGQFDVVFSNAALHWVDDHAAVFRGIASCLKPGGRVMISCGGKGNAQQVFLALRHVIRMPRFRAHFRGMKAPYFFFDADQYRAWLPPLGFEIRDVSLADTALVFDQFEKLTAWLRTTWLPYTQRVPESDRETFINVVAETFLRRHPADEHGRILIGMVRLEVDAVKK